MDRKEEIDIEIQKALKEIDEIKGTRCEVYTRIVGYYRAITNWNAGKAVEYEDRITYRIKED